MGEVSVSGRSIAGKTAVRGLGGMLGAGVFVGLAPATAAAGPWMLLAIPVAGAMALFAARSAVAIGHSFSGPGSSYVSVRARVGLIPGRISASTHLAGHVAAVAAIAGAIGRYTAPSMARGVAAIAAVAAVLASTAGLRIRGSVGRTWLVWTLVVIGVVVASCLAIAPVPSIPAHLTGDSGLGITGAAGVLFFGYLGFERMAATPDDGDGGRRWRGIVVALSASTVILLVTGAALMYQLGPARLELSPAPMLDALGAASAASLAPAVGIGAAVAMVPALLVAFESLRDTGRAAVAHGDLPRVFGRTGRAGTPYLLEVAAGIAAAVLAQILDPAAAMGVAACCLLIHYALVNMGARLLGDSSVRKTCVGMILAVILAMSMPVLAMLSTFAVAVVGPVLAGAFSGRWR